MSDKQDDLKTEKRERILAVAEEVIVAKGIEAATMDEIAEAAEISKGALYLYYKSKDELYLALHAQHGERIIQVLSAILAEQANGVELVQKVSDTYIDHVLHTPGVLSSINYFENYRDVKKLQKMEAWPRVEKTINSLFSIAIRAFQVGIADGTISASLDPKRVALYYWAGIRGLIDMHLMRTRNECVATFKTFDDPIEELIKGYHELMLKSIASATNLTLSQKAS